VVLPAGEDGPQLKVVSASRRVDMVAGYRDELLRLLRGDWPPPRVHTVVVWTKSPPALEGDRALRDFLSKYDQIFLHLTVTGLGGTALEPRAPRWRDSARSLPGLVDFAGSPERVRLRFDPLLEVRTCSGDVLSNLHLFEDVAGAAAECGIRHISTSWATSYKKVSSRLKARGMELIAKGDDELKEMWEDINARADAIGVTLHACCMPGRPRSRCIDGGLLNRLHPKGYACSTKRARGQRPLCGCTESYDIGWYRSCPTGCLYCYGNPAVAAPRVKGRGEGR
jgi:DNA repair photolyase